MTPRSRGSEGFVFGASPGREGAGPGAVAAAAPESRRGSGDRPSVAETGLAGGCRACRQELLGDDRDLHGRHGRRGPAARASGRAHGCGRTQPRHVLGQEDRHVQPARDAMGLGHEPIEGLRATHGFLGRTRLGAGLSAVSSQAQELVAGVAQRDLEDPCDSVAGGRDAVRHRSIEALADVGLVAEKPYGFPRAELRVGDVARFAQAGSARPPPRGAAAAPRRAPP